MKSALLPCALIVLVAACADDSSNPTEVSNEFASTASALGATETIDLGTLGGSYSYALDINAQGTVVGWSALASGEDHAFKWTAQTGMIDLGTLPGHTQSRAMAITESGRILGVSWGADQIRTVVTWPVLGPGPARVPVPVFPGATYRNASDMNDNRQIVGDGNGTGIVYAHAWFWHRQDELYDINGDIPGGHENYAASVNSWGTVAGSNATPAAECGLYRAFVWSRAGGYQNLGLLGPDPVDSCARSAVSSAAEINDQGVVAGTIQSIHGSGAFVWSAGTGMTLLPGMTGDDFRLTTAAAISNGGVVAGAARSSGGDPNHAVIWLTDGSLVDLTPGSSIEAAATAVNDSNLVAGFASAGPEGQLRATVWRVGTTTAIAEAARDSQSLVRGPNRVMGRTSCFGDPRAILSKSALADCLASKSR